MSARFENVTAADLTMVEGVLPHLRILDALESISPVKQSYAFVEHVKNELGFSVAQSYAMQAAIYNQIGEALNQLGKEVSAGELCAYLNIAYFNS